MTQSIVKEMSPEEIKKQIKTLTGSCKETTPEERQRREEELKGKDRSYIIRKLGLDNVAE